MRNTIIVAAAAGLIGMFATSGANALTNTSPAGIRTATEAMDTSALVRCHCRDNDRVEIRRGHRVG